MASSPEEKVNVQLARLGGSKEPLEVNLYWTVNELLDRVRVRVQIDADTLRLLCKGKMLNESIGDKTLKSLKLKANDKIIVMNKKSSKKATPSDHPSVSTSSPSATATTTTTTTNNHNSMSIDATLQRRKNIEEIKAAAEKLALRDNDGYDWNANYYIELTNQRGQVIHLPSEQRQALTVGLTLHAKGQTFMQQQNYTDAIYIMHLAFESFGRVSQEFLHMIDNYGLLALDIVWCYYLAQDESSLSNAGQWLQIAEYGLKRAHGEHLERLRQIRGGGGSGGDFIPELSLYVRLNILRALQSFYNNDLNVAHTHLMRAEMDLRKIQISDVDLVRLESMGFTHQESSRALRFCAGDLERAITHIYQKREEREEKLRRERERAMERRKQRQYGATKSGKFVDLKLLQQLQEFGVEHEIAVEALRQTDNSQEALNLCTDPMRKEVLAATLFARCMNDSRLYEIEQVMEVLNGDMVGGDAVAVVSEARVRAALFLAYNDVEEAVSMLSAPSVLQVLDLDRVELRFVEYVQRRQERLLRQALERQKQLQQQEQEQEQAQQQQSEQSEADDAVMADENGDNADDADNEDEDANDVDDAVEDQAVDADADDDDMKTDDAGNIVAPQQIEAKAMPNPDLGDTQNDGSDNDADAAMNNLVDDFQPISRHAHNEDDSKIEQHLLEDFDDDDEKYLDIDLTAETDALQNIKVLLNSLDANASAQDNQQTFLSLFKK